MFGFDADTPATARATVRFALRERIDTAQFLTAMGGGWWDWRDAAARAQTAQ